MTLEVKKIYVDSRYRTADSVDDNAFEIQLARNIYLPSIGSRDTVNYP